MQNEGCRNSSPLVSGKKSLHTCIMMYVLFLQMIHFVLDEAGPLRFEHSDWFDFDDVRCIQYMNGNSKQKIKTASKIHVYYIN